MTYTDLTDIKNINVCLDVRASKVVDNFFAHHAHAKNWHIVAMAWYLVWAFNWKKLTFFVLKMTEAILLRFRQQDIYQVSVIRVNVWLIT